MCLDIASALSPPTPFTPTVIFRLLLFVPRNSLFMFTPPPPSRPLPVRSYPKLSTQALPLERTSKGNIVFMYPLVLTPCSLLSLTPLQAVSPFLPLNLCFLFSLAYLHFHVFFLLPVPLSISISLLVVSSFVLFFRNAAILFMDEQFMTV